MLFRSLPKGRWSEHFSIICWPITHAILPQDLQRQLAKILYDLRYYFSGDLLEAPEELGKIVEARCWNSSSRFQNLAEEHVLIGQIATALLQHDDEIDNSLIFPPTLKRIRSDLEMERQAREWLDRKSTRLNSSHIPLSRMPSSA